MESGDFGDNLEIFLNARYQMKTGSHKDGLQTIQTLRCRIIATGEVKSNRWLIPTLDAVLSENELPENEDDHAKFLNTNIGIDGLARNDFVLRCD